MCTSTLTDLTTICQAVITRDTRLMSADSFEEFLTPTKYYGDNAYIRNAHGIAKTIVERMNGTITAEYHEDKLFIIVKF